MALIQLSYILILKKYFKIIHVPVYLSYIFSFDKCKLNAIKMDKKIRETIKNNLLLVQVIALFVVIFGINTTSDI